MASHKLTLELNEEQREAVLAFINFNSWEVNIVEDTNNSQGNYHRKSFLVFANSLEDSYTYGVNMEAKYLC